MRIETRNSSPIRLVAVVGLFCAMCMPAMAQTTYIFDVSIGHWNDPDDWDPPTGPPAAGDTAIILVNQDCAIPLGYDAEIDVLEIQKSSDGASYGEVFICSGGSLTIKADCPKVDGILWFWKSAQGTAPGELIIDGDITMTGRLSTTANVPAYIDTESDNSVSGIIKGVDASSKLTLAGAEAYSDLVVIGKIDIQVELVNEAKVGNAWGTREPGFARTLTLSTNPKSGDGIWFASHGTLLVADGCTVSGPGRWELNEEVPPYAPVLQFDEQALGLTGDFDIQIGTLLVNDSIKTEGRLDFHRSFEDLPVEIRVAVNKIAEFGFASCP